MSKPLLYNYFRSSTSLRVRVGLNIKKIDYDYFSLHLRKDEHRSSEYLKINPYGLVPSIKFSSGLRINQSLAILEYLDENYPSPPILPKNSVEKVKVRAMAYAIAFEIHPINNLQVLNYLKNNLSINEKEIKKWFSNWVHKTFLPFENTLSENKEPSLYCFGNTPTIADICLFSQVVNNARFDIDMSSYPLINAIFKRCLENENFEKALPINQPDAE